MVINCLRNISPMTQDEELCIVVSATNWAYRSWTSLNMKCFLHLFCSTLSPYNLLMVGNVATPGYILCGLGMIVPNCCFEVFFFNMGHSLVTREHSFKLLDQANWHHRMALWVLCLIMFLVEKMQLHVIYAYILNPWLFLYDVQAYLRLYQWH